jgi:predicted signal transduction protein with EAL and GGDEF domain
LQRLNDENRRLAMTDSLTGLANRRQFYADLDAWAPTPWPTARRTPLPLACWIWTGSNRSTTPMAIRSATVCWRRLAKQLRATAGPSVRVYRLGGDEFGLIDSNVDDFTRTCERLLQQVRAPLRIGEIVLSVGGSLGMAQYPDAGTKAADLFDRADYALYHAKHVNGGAPAFFTPSLETAVRADRAIEAALQASSFEDELSIVLQPIVELSSGRLNAVEVLAAGPIRCWAKFPRWNSSPLPKDRPRSIPSPAPCSKRV